MHVYTYIYALFDIHKYAYICNLAEHTYWGDKIFRRKLSKSFELDSRLRHVMRTAVPVRFIIDNFI